MREPGSVSHSPGIAHAGAAVFCAGGQRVVSAVQKRLPTMWNNRLI
jgi:hypothetical protein